MLTIFWGFKPICALELTAFYLPFTPLILLSRPSYFVLSVFLSMALHCGDCHLPICTHWKSLLIICWEKFGKLPRHCHTSILHCISSLQSLYNVVICRSHMLCQKARATRISLIRDIFTEAPQLSYTTFGFNVFNYSQYWRTYSDADKVCSNFIRDVKLFPLENKALIDEIYYLCIIVFNTILYIYIISLLTPIVVWKMKFNNNKSRWRRA